jgi:hypothetical protein
MERIRDTTVEQSVERKAAVSALKYPTAEDVVNLANTLKNFVDSK